MSERVLLTPGEVDVLLRYPTGRARRLALKGMLPYLLLPDGELRFDQADIDALLHARRSGLGDRQ